ncbi:hypothetical protein BDC45DRAFT_540795 [Circinella umbellata]|nr:hypothetical protein BDC45DRAFT_540795 [Circinella umbellata]
MISIKNCLCIIVSESMQIEKEKGLHIVPNAILVASALEFEVILVSRAPWKGVHYTLDTTISNHYDNGTLIEDKIHTHDIFHRRPMKGFACFQYSDDNSYTDSDENDVASNYIYKYSQILLLFEAQYKKQIYQLVLAQGYMLLNEEHITGLKVVIPALNANSCGLFVMHLKNIKNFNFHCSRLCS